MAALRPKYKRFPIKVPNGRTIGAYIPGTSAVTLVEHELRDLLARQLQGGTEANLGFGRADVLTSSKVFEVEPCGAWRHAVRQALQYAAQTDCTPAIALFGKSDHVELKKLYLKLRDNNPPVELWWWAGPYLRWVRISSTAKCLDRHAPAVGVSVGESGVAV